jgi:glycosyltransferase involved in cell wall biosynthesis
VNASRPSPKPSPVPVLLTVRKLDWGGIERDVTKLLVGLDRTRFTPYVAVYQAGGLRSDEVKQAGVPILDLEITSLILPGIVRSIVKFCRGIRRNRIRVVHAFDATAVFAIPLARLMRVPLVLSSALAYRSLFDPRTRKQVLFTDRLVDGIVVNCEAMRRHIMNNYGLAQDRVLLCYNGVETSEFYPQPSSKPDPVAAASLVIGSVCVLRLEKRIEMLLEAFARVRETCGGLKLLIVGSGPELPRLKVKAADLKIEAGCTFLPAVSSVAPFLRAMDVFVSCSSSEAFSNSVLEAMACGCCPLGSRVGGTPELIEDGKLGLLFENGNVQELSEKLALLIENRDLRLRLARNAAQFAAENLNMKVALNRISQIYEEGLAKKEERALKHVLHRKKE